MPLNNAMREALVGGLRPNTPDHVSSRIRSGEPLDANCFEPDELWKALELATEGSDTERLALADWYFDEQSRFAVMPILPHKPDKDVRTFMVCDEHCLDNRNWSQHPTWPDAIKRAKELSDAGSE